MLNTFIKFTLKFLTTFFVLINISHAAGGIALGATRLIYEQDKKQASMPVINSTTGKRFLINAWVEDHASKKIKSVVVTPPMFVSEPKSENSLRIINADQNIAKDRETLYYLNVQAIPSVDKKELEQSNVLQLAIVSRIKMMMRPPQLSTRVEDAPGLLKVNNLNSKLSMNNPTPYYMTLVNILVDDVKQDNFMMEPFSEKSLTLSGRKVSYQTINDYGAFTQVITINVQ